MYKRNYQTSEDEISLQDIIVFLSKSWKYILLGGLASAMLGGAYVFLTPKTFEATASIQMAMVAGSEIESHNLLFAKLQIPTYFSKNTIQKCNLTNQMNAGSLLAKALKPAANKIAPYVVLKYTASNSDDAVRCIEAVIEDIRIHQDLLARPIIEIKRNQLINLLQKLASAEDTIKKISIDPINLDFNDAKFSPSALVYSILLTKQNEVADLKIQVNNLAMSLTDPQTRDTSLVAPIYSESSEISKQKVLVVTFFAGIFLTVMFLMGKNAWGKLVLLRPNK